MNGFLLSQDDQYLAFVLRIGDVMTLAGVNIFDKKMIVHRPATKDDPFLTLVPASEPAQAAEKTPMQAQAPEAQLAKQ